MINMIVDMIHIVICLVIIALAVILFIGPTKYVYCYPIIFFLAGVMNFSSAYAHMNRYTGGRGRYQNGVGNLILGIIFFVLAIVSALTVF